MSFGSQYLTRCPVKSWTDPDWYDKYYGYDEECDKKYHCHARYFGIQSRVVDYFQLRCVSCALASMMLDSFWGKVLFFSVRMLLVLVDVSVSADLSREVAKDVFLLSIMSRTGV